MALALAGVAIVELGVIEAICQWCVASAVVMTALAGLSIALFLAGEFGESAHYDAAMRETPDGDGRRGAHT